MGALAKSLHMKSKIVAEDAVLIGPVSGSNSLITGKITGNLPIPAFVCDFNAQSIGGFNGLQQNSLCDGTENESSFAPRTTKCGADRLSAVAMDLRVATMLVR